VCVYVCKKLCLRPKNIDKWLSFDAEVIKGESCYRN